MLYTSALPSERSFAFNSETCARSTECGELQHVFYLGPDGSRIKILSLAMVYAIIMRSLACEMSERFPVLSLFSSVYSRAWVGSLRMLIQRIELYIITPYICGISICYGSGSRGMCLYDLRWTEQTIYKAVLHRQVYIFVQQSSTWLNLSIQMSFFSKDQAQWHIGVS